MLKNLFFFFISFKFLSNFLFWWIYIKFFLNFNQFSVKFSHFPSVSLNFFLHRANFSKIITHKFPHFSLNTYFIRYSRVSFKFFLNFKQILSKFLRFFSPLSLKVPVDFSKFSSNFYSISFRFSFESFWNCSFKFFQTWTHIISF